MKDPANLLKFTTELLENGFIDEDYFYSKKLNGTAVHKKN